MKPPTRNASSRRWLSIGLIGGLFAGGLTLARTPPADDDLAMELPRINPLTHEQAIESFKVHAGFHLETVAAEPLVASPVSACYDADGRLYVVQMRGYPYPEKSPTGNVSLLEDTDGDGKFDKSTIFVDGLSWPTGVVPSDGGVFIAVAPDILYAKDTNGDGVADVKKVMFTGFGTQNVQGLMNGLIWGPDGWIYGTSSSNGGDIRNLSRPNAKPVSVRGRDFRFRPDGSAFEAISGGGQFGHAFDDWGHRFTCSNSNHIRQIVLESRYLERNPSLAVPSVVADIAVDGPAAPVFRISAPEPWRVVRTRQRVADPVMLAKLPPTERFAAGFFTSATGVTIYRGSAFPQEYRGNAFIGDVGANLVHRKILRPKGSIYEAVRADKDVEFLASPDNWFRPVNFANTPNGTLLVLDMYRETIEHPLSIPDPIKKHLDLTSGCDRGRLYEILPDGFRRRAKPALTRATTAELVDHLADPDAWWRETAQRLLIERRDQSVFRLLRGKFADRRTLSAVGRTHALWTIAAMGGLVDADLLLAFGDSSPRVREQAVALVSTWKEHSRELDLGIGRLANDPDPMVRFRVAQAPSDGVGGDPLKTLSAILRKDAADPWTRFAVYSNATPDIVWNLLMTGTLFHGFDETPDGRIIAGELAELVGANKATRDIEKTLELLPDDAVAPHIRSAVLRGLGRGLQRSGASLRGIVAKSKTRGPIEKVFDQAAREAIGEGEASARIAAIEIVGLGPVESAMTMLPGLLDARQPGEVQLAALRAIGELPDDRVGRVVIDHWKSLSPTVRREAAEVLFARAERLNALLDAIEAKGFAAGELDAGRRKAMLNHPDRSVRERAARQFAAEPKSDRGLVIAAARPALSLAGDRDKGRAVFEKTCLACHKAEGRGETLGPDLATVVGRTPEDLLVHILDPNREVSPQYLDYSVATTDGRIFTGIIASETANAVTLRRAGGVTDVIPRNGIEAISSSGISLMPEGLEKGLTNQDFADLIAYLRGLQPATSAK